MGNYSSYKNKEMSEMEKYYYWDDEGCGKERHCCEERCCCEDRRCDHKHDHKDDHKHDEKHDKKHHHKKDKADLVDFEYDTLRRNVDRPNRWRLPRNRQEPVASVTLDKVKKGDLVWLNGVIGLDNDDSNSVARIIMRIFKGNPPVYVPGDEIYRCRIEIDEGGRDDQVVEPLAHVDVIRDDDKDVTYTVTLESDERPVFVNGPVTFTAAQIRKDKK